MLSTIDPTNETLKTWHNRAFIMWMVCWQYVTPILLIVPLIILLIFLSILLSNLLFFVIVGISYIHVD